MRGSESEQTGNIGEQSVTLKFTRLGWHVAPNPAGEVGTDLLLQARDERRFDHGAFIGAQVKSGESFFREPKVSESGEVEGWWYRDPDAAHLRYWQTHTVPHLLILHDETDDQSYWVHVTKGNVVSTGKGAKIFVPKSSVVSRDHAEELLRVATAQRMGPRWEGSAWGGGVSILPPERLRYALLTPRLIAPHPNLTITSLRPDEAIAMLIKMRVDDLTPSRVGPRTGAPEIEQCRTSDDWGWRLYAALHDVLINGAEIGSIEMLIDDAAAPHERAAAAAILCALKVEVFDPSGGLQIVDSVLSRDDCDPTDHCWLLLHKSRCLSELGDLQQSREIAFELQRLRATAPDDPTAMAIAGAGADIVFTASGWGSDLGEVISGRDTIASWWRNQEIGSALQSHFDDHFKAWADGAADTSNGVRNTWLRLRAATLLSGLSADHTSWRHSLGLLARHVLTFSSDPGSISEALNDLRVVGDSKTIEMSVRRVLRHGPATAVQSAAQRVNFDTATRTSIRADLQMLTSAADVLEPESADAAARWILTFCDDLPAFAARFRPMFNIHSILSDALAELVPVVTPETLLEVVDQVVSLPPQDDQGWAHDWAKVIKRVPEDAWSVDDRVALASRGQADHFELREVLDAVLAAGDSQAREALRERIRQGDLAALDAFSDLRDLDSDSVHATMSHLGAAIDKQINVLRRGSSAHRGLDCAGTLVVMNVSHPGAARWDPLIELLSVRAPFVNHLIGTLRNLRRFGDDVPDIVATKLVDPLRELMTTGDRDLSIFGREDVRGRAASALAAVDIDAITEDELVALMEADDRNQRAAAAEIVAARSNGDMSALYALSRDDDPWVRAVIANRVADQAVRSDRPEHFMPLVIRMLSGEGTLVARMVAVALPDVQSAGADQLVGILHSHSSAEVRRVVGRYRSNSRGHSPVVL
ncbi:DUF4365 domain-containing protein [Prescottella equi]|uniref:DUF4365 domain-containing protein n=1 Tax=Rhodococcus hoagii TaxID=43767 RepID=UPI000A12323F|nr:DUF4365 domain-containing protein [Prescottella equi]